MDTTAAVIVHHELAKYDPGFTLAYLAHAMLFVNNFYHCSNAEQKARYLPQVLSGEWVAGMGMTEPGAGTDVLGMTTTAVRDGDEYVMNGTKTYITNGCEGHCFLVYAKVEGRVTAFVVDRDCPGFSTSHHIDKLGHARLDDVGADLRGVPGAGANLLGAVGSGLTHMMRNLEIERAHARGDERRHRRALRGDHGPPRPGAAGVSHPDQPLRPDPALHRRRLRDDRGRQVPGLQRRPRRSAPTSATASAPTPPSCSRPRSARPSPTTRCR
jgi:hypothetical protein